LGGWGVDLSSEVGFILNVQMKYIIYRITYIY
jgi:hypothetical protein